MKMKIILPIVLFISLTGKAQQAEKIPELLKKLDTASDPYKLKFYTELATIYDIQDKFDSALFYNTKALKVAEKIGNKTAMGDAYNNMAICYYNYSQYDKAMELYLKALKIYEKEKKYRDVISTLSNISGIYSEQDNYDLALKQLFEAVEMNSVLKDTMNQIYLYANICRNYALKDDSKKIYEYSGKGLALVDLLLKNPTLNSVDSGRILNAKPYLEMLLANGYLRDKRYDESIRLYTKLLEQERKKIGIKDRVEILESLANNYNELHKFDSAMVFVSEALDVLKKDSIPESYRDIYEQQSISYAGLGQYEKAFSAYKKFKQVSDTILNNENLSTTSEMHTKYETEKKDQQINLLNKEKKSQRTIIGLSLGAATVALGFLVSAIRSRKLQQKLFIQKEELSTKEKEIEMKVLEKKMTELEQMALRAQMNPHFIFNSLNSVQHYVMKQDVEGVNKYLSAFAHLIRQTLSNSGKQFVSVEEEIKYLDTYLSLEKMKSNNQFNYSIHVDEAVDRSATFIPGMILQPYVENSIKHGVTHMEHNDGQVTISLSKNDKLVCIIEDNGIGRQKANEIKAGRGPAEFESRGMSITANRIETINKIYNTDINIQVNDRMDQSGKLSGTTVRLEFPANLE